MMGRQSKVQNKLFYTANASNNSVVNQKSLKRYFNKSYQILESRLEQQAQSCNSDGADPG
jgi:hypothetical protein